ncbi:iron complex transport system substrate-binding protein [Pseudonocardia hierapolitana]|uniref:Iron complex transport system substrate-binding protein n=1 Tax=Pseudonocardia hierapolitana TaxID=1128676 RepID=A0A561SM67_9PSEU|nr:iron-siderophore ABC transporter substrate-binding protein [Pseudonocardia hierapolitana]TWF75958.1 iron complex transport system substrate-binding protein [Pseudonocardia hierapolitana]
MRWMAAAGALVLALVAGCGGTPDTGSAGPGNTDVATGGRLFSTADEATAKLGADAAPGVFPRTITHARGTTRLEQKPQRVVVLDTGEIDAVLALGIVPIGTATPNGTVPSYLQPQLAGSTNVGSLDGLRLEAIAALQPDLILGSQLRVDELYDQLSAIAPTVLSIRPGFPWKENLLLAGAALGEETKATELLNDYQRRADAIRARFTQPPTISLLRFMPERIRLYGNLSMIGVVLKDVGLPRPANQDIQELAAEISPERISESDADWIFYSSYGPKEGTAEGSVVGGELWNRLGAVQRGTARPVDDEVWFLGLGPMGASRVLDDLQAFLA